MLRYGECPFAQSNTSGQPAQQGKRAIGSREGILGNQNQLNPRTHSQFSQSTRINALTFGKTAGRYCMTQLPGLFLKKVLDP